MVEANPAGYGNVMVYINGEGGNNDIYQENLEELGLF